MPRDKADEVTGDIDAFLNESLKTSKIKDSDIIEEPGKTYTKEEMKHLVRLDEIITITNDKGELEQRKLDMIRKGREARDRAKRDSSAKKIPKDVLMALHSRNETLKLMAGTEVAGNADAMSQYAEELKEWKKQVAESGAEIYPAIKGYHQTL